MSHCYVCGRPVPKGAGSPRRKVKTGEWLRRRPKGGPPSSVNVGFGMRVVCPWCARRIDAERRREEMVQYAELAIALVLHTFAILSGLLKHK